MYKATIICKSTKIILKQHHFELMLCRFVQFFSFVRQKKCKVKRAKTYQMDSLTNVNAIFLNILS